MLNVGSLRFQVVMTGKVTWLKILGQPVGLETLATEEELLALSAYLEREIAKWRKEKGGE